jgi:hypothetical protein
MLRKNHDTRCKNTQVYSHELALVLVQALVQALELELVLVLVRN